MADYECFPIWRDSPSGTENVSPEEIGLPRELASALNSWADRFDETLDRADPSRSGFKDTATEQAFYSDGTVMAEQVATILGARFEILFFDARTGKLTPAGR